MGFYYGRGVDLHTAGVGYSGMVFAWLLSALALLGESGRADFGEPLGSEAWESDFQ